MCIFLVIGDGGNVDENNFARDDQRQSRLDETTIPFVTPEATSTRQTRCISIAPVLFEKKKKGGGSQPPSLLTSLDLRARSEGPSPLSLESINVALQRGPVYPVKPTPFSLS